MHVQDGLPMSWYKLIFTPGRYKKESRRKNYALGYARLGSENSRERLSDTDTMLLVG